MKTRILLAATAFTLATIGGALGQSATTPVPVNPDNFVRAETDMYLGNLLKDGPLGKFNHTREPASIDRQTIIRMNRDTLYSFAVFDLDAGPATVTLPDVGKRFRSVQVIDQDQFTPRVIYKASTYTFTRKEMGTRYMALLMRVLVDPADPEDLKKVHAVQDGVRVTQAGAGTFEVPNYDAASHKKVRDALLVLASTMKDFKGAFGPKGKVDPVHRLIGTAAGWGGNPDKDATYVGHTPPKNDGKTIYTLKVKDVPVDAFWSISVYNAQGYFEKNPENAYTVNDITAKRESDGSVNVQFGGCDGKAVNCIPTTNGWNYLVRLYRPRAEVLSGKWTFPEAQAVQ